MKSIRFFSALIFIWFICGTQAQTSLLDVDFQSGMPANFTLVDNDNFIPAPGLEMFDAAWIVTTDPDNPSDTVAASTSYFEPAGTADRWLITPPLSLGSFGNFIRWEARSQDASFPDDYLVLVSTTDSELTSFTDTIGSINEENVDWTTRQVNLSEAGYNDSNIFVAFVLQTEDGYKLYIDDISVWKEDPASVTEMSNQIQIFPNPANEFIQLMATEKMVKCRLFSMDGRLVYEGTDTTIDVRNIECGRYILHVYGDQHNFSTPVIIAR